MTSRFLTKNRLMSDTDRLWQQLRAAEKQIEVLTAERDDALRVIREMLKELRYGAFPGDNRLLTSHEWVTGAINVVGRHPTLHKLLLPDHRT